MVAKQFQPEEVVQAVEKGIKELKSEKIDDIDALAKVVFSENAGPISIKIGAAPTIQFKDVQPKEVYTKTVPYTARMQIMEATFESTNERICLKEVGFHSLVTPGATFSLNYELVSYCKKAKLNSKNHCFILDKGETIEFILPYFEQCEDLDIKEKANCYCTSIKSNRESLMKNMSDEELLDDTFVDIDFDSTVPNNSKLDSDNNYAYNFNQNHILLTSIFLFFILYFLIRRR